MPVSPSYFNLSGFSFPSVSASIGVTQPNIPKLDATRLSTTSTLAQVTGDAGATNRVYWAQLGSGMMNYAGEVVGNGSVTITSMAPAEGSFWLFAVSVVDSIVSLPAFTTICLASPDSILAAVGAKFDASPVLRQTFTDGIYTDEIPETTTELPAVLMESLGGSFDYTFSPITFEHVKVRFTVYASGAASVESALNQIRTVFDWKGLTFESATLIHAFPTQSNLYSEPMRWKDGRLIFRSTIEYEITIQTNGL